MSKLNRNFAKANFYFIYLIAFFRFNFLASKVMANLRHTQGNGFKLSCSVDLGNSILFPKYGRDGTGRDAYIAGNNGGFYSKYQENARGLIYGGDNIYVGNSQAGPRNDIFPSIPGKHVSYNTNGTGRDSYIHKSNGGFYPG